MSSTTFIHPLTGKPCSKQRRHQVLNVLNGRCAYHAKEPIFRNRQCAQCFAKYLARLQSRRVKTRKTPVKPVPPFAEMSKYLQSVGFTPVSKP